MHPILLGEAKRWQHIYIFSRVVSNLGNSSGLIRWKLVGMHKCMFNATIAMERGGCVGRSVSKDNLLFIYQYAYCRKSMCTICGRARGAQVAVIIYLIWNGYWQSFIRLHFGDGSTYLVMIRRVAGTRRGATLLIFNKRVALVLAWVHRVAGFNFFVLRPPVFHLKRLETWKSSCWSWTHNGGILVGFKFCLMLSPVFHFFSFLFFELFWS